MDGLRRKRVAVARETGHCFRLRNESDGEGNEQRTRASSATNRLEVCKGSGRLLVYVV